MDIVEIASHIRLGGECGDRFGRDVKPGNLQLQLGQEVSLERLGDLLLSPELAGLPQGGHCE